MIERREFLATLSSGLALAGFGPAMAASKPHPRSLALCDISIRNALAKDYAGTLKKVAAIGYTHFSYRLERYFSMEPEDLPPAEKARMARDAGLLPGVVRFIDPKNIDRYIEEANLVGSKILALTVADIFLPSSLGGQYDKSPLTKMMVDDFAGRLDSWGAKARAAGISLAYHNHAVDSKPVEGIRPFDRIIELTNPCHVAIELDLAWTYAGGYDILETIERLGPRLVSMHWKDYDSSRAAQGSQQAVELGAGEIGLAQLLPKVVERTKALPGVEIENSTEELASAQRAFDFIQKVTEGR